jgi:hypothetical protein
MKARAERALVENALAYLGERCAHELLFRELLQTKEMLNINNNRNDDPSELLIMENSLLCSYYLYRQL